MTACGQGYTDIPGVGEHIHRYIQLPGVCFLVVFFQYKIPHNYLV